MPVLPSARRSPVSIVSVLPIVSLVATVAFVLWPARAVAQDAGVQRPGPRAVGSASEQQTGQEARPLAGPEQRRADEQNSLPMWPFEEEFRFWTFPQDYRLSAELSGAIRDLHRLYQDSAEKGVDEQGRPTIPHPRFAERRDQLLPLLDRQAGWLGYVLKDSRSMQDRQLAGFGLFFCPDVREVAWCILYGAYEPNPVLRRQFLTWAKPWLEVRLGERFTADEAQAAHPPTPENRQRRQEGQHRIELTYVQQLPGTLERLEIEWADTFLDLLRAPKPEDRILALETLEILGRTRPAEAAEALWRGRRQVRSALAVEHLGVRAAARAYLNALDPERPCPAEPELAQAHFDALLDRLFPEIEIRGSVALLYDGELLERVVQLGEQLLENGKLGYAAHGRSKQKSDTRTYYGVKLNPLPEPLDALGLEPGTLIHTVDGTPVRSCEDLLTVLRAKIGAKATSIVVEYLGPTDEPGLRRYVRKGERR